MAEYHVTKPSASIPIPKTTPTYLTKSKSSSSSKMTTSNVPINPRLPVLDVSRPHTFITPVKNINEGHDVSDFLMSKAYSDIMTFVLQLNKAMFPSSLDSLALVSKKVVQNWDLGTPNLSFSETVHSLRNLLDDLQRILDEVPPDPGPRRFGNASFRKWSQVVEEQAEDLLDKHLPTHVLSFNGTPETSIKQELQTYLLGSFGSPQRLDYGTGHELSFLAFLGCIWKLGGFKTDTSGDEERGIVLGVFEPYLALTRRLIKTYTLEPAGSHGVWGLDDHSFLPYLFGSAQYAPAISTSNSSAVEIPTEGARDDAPNPADVTKAMVVERERKRNLYFGAVGFIYDVKRGPFWEHSPMLFDISGVRGGWGKINKGMIKMYNAEVLSKFPVVQHFRFGSLFSWDRDPNTLTPPTSIHTSNQPATQAVVPPSINQPAARTPLPHPAATTSAPWATKPGGMPSRPMQSASTRLPPSQTLTPMASSLPDPTTTTPTTPSPQPMPPPTRAPWAKPDT